MTDRAMERRIAALVARQHGVIGRPQAVRLGMSAHRIARRVTDGSWLRVHPGVYRPAVVPRTWRSDVMAAVLWAGPAALASHRAAGRLWGLDGLEDAPVEILAPVGRVVPGVVVHRSAPEDCPRRRLVEEIPVTAPDRTILDLCAVLTARAAGVAVDDALRRGLVTLRRLHRFLVAEGGRGRRGTATLRRILTMRDETDARMESELERRLFRLLRRAGLPEPVPQYEVSSRGRLIARLDFAYPNLRIGIETHGFRWHGGRERWRSDIARENRLKRMGWVVLVFTWDDVVNDPAEIVEAVRSLLPSDVLLPEGRC